MKKLYFLFIAILLANMQIVKGQTIYWSEDFEGSTSDWAVDAGTWEMGQPTSGPNSGHLGSQNCAATVLAGNYAEGVNSKLIYTPFITIPASNQNPRLRFWQWYNISTGDYGKVQIKSIDSTTWKDISVQYVNTGSGIWTYPSIDLTLYAGQTVQFAFSFHSEQVGYYANVSSGWYIDDISIVTGTAVFNNPETWENGIGDWYVDKGTWEVGTPSIGPSTAHGGTKCAGTVMSGNYDESVDSKLISPATTIPSSNQNPRMRFWQWYNISTGDYGKVQIKSIDSTTWKDISVQYVNTGSGIWTYPSIDLTLYAGQTVQFAFSFHSEQVGYYANVSNGWYIDDISIVTGTAVFNNPETWENGIGDWYVDKGTWEVGTPSIGPSTAHGGTKCAGTVMSGNYDESVDSKLISPATTIPSSNQNPRMRFWQWYNISTGDYGKVQIKSIDSTTWKDISVQYVNTGSGIWTYPSIDLTLYAGQTVQFAFSFHSEQVGYYANVSSGWYIDDISIVTGTAVFNNPETWENGIGDWYVDKGTWEVGTPSIGPSTAHGGTKCAGTVMSGNYDESVDSKLISPAFTVPDLIQYPSLRFYQWYNFAAGDTGRVQIKAVDSTVWKDINLSTYYTNTSSGVWSCPYFDLHNYAGQVVQIAFLFHSEQVGYYANVSSGWYIDDVSINYTRYHNAGVTEIIKPDSVISLYSSNLPKAIVKNFGLLADTIPVNFSIYPAYSADTSIILQPNQSDTVTFEEWTPLVQSTYTAECKTQLISDELHSNDSINKTVLVSGGVLEIHSITPNHGGNTGSVTVEIDGEGFLPGVRVKLTKAGEADIIIDTSTIVVESLTKIRCEFAFNNTALGGWNIVVNNPGINTTIFFGGFIVDSVVQHLWVNISGSQVLRIGFNQIYTLTIGNDGNTDAYLPFVFIEGLPIGTRFEILSDTIFGGESIPLFDTLGIDWDSINNENFIDPTTMTSYYAIQIYKLPVNSTNSINIIFHIPNATPLHATYQISVKISGALSILPDSSKAFNLMECLGDLSGVALKTLMNITNVSNWLQCAGNITLLVKNVYGFVESISKQQYNPLNNNYNPLIIWKPINILSGILKTATSCANASGNLILPLKIVNYLLKFKQLFEFIGTTNTIINFEDHCYDINLPGIVGQCFYNILIGNAWDPNDKVGPGAGSSGHFTNDNDHYNYSIRFENDTLSTFPAQTIRVYDTLDVSKFNLHTFKFTTVTLGTKLLIADNPKYFISDIDFTQEYGVKARIKGEIDTIIGVICWTMNTIDPLTNQITTDITAGFLPPDTLSPNGQGNVDFLVDLMPGISNGDTIKNQATIIFDYNTPIITPPWQNIIDTIKPISFLIASNNICLADSVLINWYGSDVFSGIRYYTIYISEDSINYRPWVNNTSATSSYLLSNIDTTYFLYSIATDSAGNVENKPITCDSKVKFVNPTGIDVFNSTLGISIYPNPAKGKIIIECPAILQNQVVYIYNIQGQLLLKYTMHQVKTELDISDFSSGLYFLSVKSDDGVVVKKFVKE